MLLTLLIYISNGYFYRLALAMISHVNPKLRLKLLERLSTLISIDGYGKYFKITDPCDRNYTCIGNAKFALRSMFTNICIVKVQSI